MLRGLTLLRLFACLSVIEVKPLNSITQNFLLRLLAAASDSLVRPLRYRAKLLDLRRLFAAKLRTFQPPLTYLFGLSAGDVANSGIESQFLQIRLSVWRIRDRTPS